MNCCLTACNKTNSVHGSIGYVCVYHKKNIKRIFYYAINCYYLCSQEKLFNNVNNKITYSFTISNPPYSGNQRITFSSRILIWSIRFDSITNVRVSTRGAGKLKVVEYIFRFAVINTAYQPTVIAMLMNKIIL